MKLFSTPLMLLLCNLLLFSIPQEAEAHIKWFVEFDISDPPQSFAAIKEKFYYLNLLILSIWGVILACVMDSLWCNQLGKFTIISDLFSYHDDIALAIARIGTGIFFVGIWLVGNVILTPELLSDAWYISYIQLSIAIAVLFRKGLLLAGVGILGLYALAIYDYGLFHLLDYFTLVGLATYLILSFFNVARLEPYRLPVLYLALIFSFLWSAIEKIAYPQWFYPFLDKYTVLTMGLDHDFFIASAAFVEFTLFFLLLIANNSIILLAFFINLLITSGNIYFGKMDAIGHFPTNFILLIMLIKGPLPVKSWLFDHQCKPYRDMIKAAIAFPIVLLVLFSTYYGLHWLMY